MSLAPADSPPRHLGRLCRRLTWGQQGDTSGARPAPPRLPRGERIRGAFGRGVVHLDSRPVSHAPLVPSAFKRATLYLYPGMASLAPHTQDLWAWLASLPTGSWSAAEQGRAAWTGRTSEIGGSLQRIAPEPDAYWTETLPVALRRSATVERRLHRAVVYTINETIQTDDGLDLARKTGSDVLIRGWFKWGTPPDYAQLAPQVTKAHAMGTLFGGGITCSALYHGENGLTEQRVLDMATRGPDGQLVNAWNEPHCRHGTLSNPAYREYLLSSCKQQIDAGADYLFMDEINAALQADEGFDDYSIADFRQFLLERYGQQGW